MDEKEVVATVADAQGQVQPEQQRTKASKEDKEPDRKRLLDLLSLTSRRTREDYALLAHLSSQLNAFEHASNKPWDDRDTAELTALLAEYESLRQESMNSVNNRIRTMVLGLTVIGALAGGSLTSERLLSNPLLVTGMFSGAIPLVCVFIFFVWLSEGIRSHQVGYYLASAVEARINAKLGRLVVTWEAGVWTRVVPRDELWAPTVMALVVVGLFMAAAPWFGVFLAGVSPGLRGRPLYEVLVPYFLYVCTGLYALRHMKQLRNITTVESQMHAATPSPTGTG